MCRKARNENYEGNGIFAACLRKFHDASGRGGKSLRQYKKNIEAGISPRDARKEILHDERNTCAGTRHTAASVRSIVPVPVKRKSDTLRRLREKKGCIEGSAGYRPTEEDIPSVCIPRTQNRLRRTRCTRHAADRKMSPDGLAVPCTRQTRNGADAIRRVTESKHACPHTPPQVRRTKRTAPLHHAGRRTARPKPKQGFQALYESAI